MQRYFQCLDRIEFYFRYNQFFEEQERLSILLVYHMNLFLAWIDSFY